MSDSELMAVPEVARRIEVFTGTGRRRTWPAEVKTRIVAESYRAGETVCGVARRHGLTAQQLFTWRREARRRAAAAGEDGLSFAPVILETVPPVSDTAAAPPASTSACIEIALAGAVVRVPCGADAATLATVLRALRSAAA